MQICVNSLQALPTIDLIDNRDFSFRKSVLQVEQSFLIVKGHLNNESCVFEKKIFLQNFI